MFDEIDGNFDVVAIRTFKVGLLAEHDLRKSLTRKLFGNVCQLTKFLSLCLNIESQEPCPGHPLL